MLARRLALVALVGGACAPDDEVARRSWLQHTLTLDNQPFTERSPELVAGKFAVMGERLYPYFRGTAPQFARDALQAGAPGFVPTAYGSESTRDVALVGDPHPENIGTFRTSDGTVTVDFNDFDAATYGPYWLDVRRLALGFWIAAEQIRADQPSDSRGRLTEADRDALPIAIARAYADQVAALAQDRDAGPVLTAGNDYGVALTELIDGAIADGEEREKLLEYTRIEEAGRVMFFGEIEPARVVEIGGREQLVFEDSTRDVPARDRARIESLLEAYVPTLVDPSIAEGDAVTLKGLSRRFGAGVSSYPNLRWYALLEGPTTDLDDDVLLEIKQVWDALPLLGLVRLPDAPFQTNGDRSVFMQRALQAFEDDDPWLGWAADGADNYKLRHRTGWQRSIRVDRLREDLDAEALSPADLVVLVEWAARLLARNHGRARKQNGEHGAPAIAAAIGGDADGFAAETAEFVERYAPRVLADHALLTDLIEDEGMTLGYHPR